MYDAANPSVVVAVRDLSARPPMTDDLGWTVVAVESCLVNGKAVPASYVAHRVTDEGRQCMVMDDRGIWVRSFFVSPLIFKKPCSTG